MSKRLLIFPLVFLILLAISFIAVKTRSANIPYSIGMDKSLYSDFESCPNEARLAIGKKRFPKQMIHSCTATVIFAGNKEYRVVEVQYGPAQDCLAGCIYDYFIGAVDEKGNIIELPRKGGNDPIALAYEYIKVSPKYDLFSDCNYYISEIVTPTLAVLNGHLGWEYAFTTPLECTWKEIKSTFVTMKMDQIHTADEVTRNWSGSFFIYLENGTPKGNFENIKTAETSRKEITYEEKYQQGF